MRYLKTTTGFLIVVYSYRLNTELLLFKKRQNLIETSEKQPHNLKEVG
jgi:hypothetical protein